MEIELTEHSWMEIQPSRQLLRYAAVIGSEGLRMDSSPDLREAKSLSEPIMSLFSLAAEWLQQPISLDRDGGSITSEFQQIPSIGVGVTSS